MTKPTSLLVAAAVCAVTALASERKKQPAAQASPLDRYVAEATQGSGAPSLTPGAIYRDDGLLSDMGRDMRARNVNDLVTIVVTERASAVTTGNSKTSRQSSAKASVNALGGLTRAAGPWANLADLGSQSALDGQGSTSRQTSISTSLSARVTHVLPNGYLVLEGTKEVEVNSEKQLVTVRGVARWNDITPANTIRSDALAQLEVRINGKGIVGDAIRRPNFLARLLLGILPF
jgi:flagellar L-ring protein precursor FlgH